MIIAAVFCALWILMRNIWYLRFSKSENEDLLAHLGNHCLVYPDNKGSTEKIISSHIM